MVSIHNEKGEDIKIFSEHFIPIYPNMTHPTFFQEIFQKSVLMAL